MPIDFKLPDLGENIESGDVVNVLVQEGDQIEANQGIVEIETDKAVVEVPCPHAGTIVKLHVRPGDTVPVGAVLVTLDAAKEGGPSDKGSEVPPKASAKREQAPAKPSKPPVERVPQDDEETDETEAVAEEEEAEEPAPPPARRPAATAPSAPPKQHTAPKAAPQAPTVVRSGSTQPTDGSSASSMADSAPAGPAIRRLARELGVEINSVDGTGPGGRITREDVMSAVRRATSATGSGAPGMPSPRATIPPGTAEQDNWGIVRREKLTKIRKTIAANMVRSATAIPHVTNFDDADITELERIRKGSTAEYVDTNVKLTMMVFVMKAVSLSLKLHPLLNSSLDTENEQIVYKEYVNLGVAVDTERGLVVPVVRNVDRLAIPQVAYALATVTAQARTNKFTPEDLRGGTFTISNLGAIGGAYSTPIINHPEAAVLLVGRSRKVPVVLDDRIEARLMMPLSLSYDHRLVDGAAAARFLNEVIGFLQAPGRLLLAP